MKKKYKILVIILIIVGITANNFIWYKLYSREKERLKQAIIPSLIDDYYTNQLILSKNGHDYDNSDDYSVSDYEAVLDEYYDRYRTGSPSNSHTPSDDTLNSLIDATNASMDPEVQKKAYFELQKYENETLFTMPLYYQPIFLIESNRLETGIEKYGNPQFNYDWNIQNWKIN